MVVALETFVKQLEDSGVIAPGKLENFIPPRAAPRDAQELARQLVQSKQLTKFQAQEIYQGRAKSLILGNYTILDKIGAGGMGQVFKAEHRRMKRVVAIKMLPRAILKDVAAAARFQREVEAAAKLSHANIVAAYDADEAGGVHFLAMEYVEGSDLSVLVKQNGPFTLPKAVNYILQAARGLEFAHKKGVIHRDIKPGNLLLDNEGTVKILDMGLARLSGEGDAATQAELTGTGAVMGTVDYMSPEQALNTKQADHRADIYSLGCSLYYLLTGKPTYEAETITAKLIAHQFQPIPELRKARPEVSGKLEAVFGKMVAKKIEDRYQSMSQVVTDLEQCGVGQDQSPTMQRSIDSTALNIAGTLPTDSPAATTLKPQPTKTVARPASEGGFKDKRPLLIGLGAAGFLVGLLGVIVIFRNHDGGEVGRIELPPGHTAEVQGAAAKPAIVPAAARRITTPGDPAFQQWIKDVAALPAEQQVDAVAKKLQELNPGFDGKVKPRIEQGRVTFFEFLTDSATDISPVRALATLGTLSCNGSAVGKGKLSDLSPLEGMHLTNLSCKHNHQISDLSPLRGMKLTELQLESTQVSDLWPLQAMPLTKLNIERTQVSDLSPLQVLHLTSLNCRLTRISDLSPLEDMPLTFLDCKETQVFNLGPLHGMPLARLELDSTKVTDLSPLRGMPLTYLQFYNTPISDLSSLKGMPLTTLNCQFTQVTDLSPIQGMPLTSLVIERTQVSDLSPVKGMLLKNLNCGNSKVSDLSPLSGMPLTELVCQNTPVSDLSVLKGMPLAVLDCGGTQVSDLSPLNGMKMTQVRCFSTKVSDLSPLEGCPNLNSVNAKGIEFAPAVVESLQRALPNCRIEWDGSAKTTAPQLVAPASPNSASNDPFQQWTKNVTALPAEKQVEAVSEKLVALNPGFDGKVTDSGGKGTPKIEQGVVTEFAFATDNVADISPVRALAGLKTLKCSGSGLRKGKLSDLSSLAGMTELNYLNFIDTNVTDSGLARLGFLPKLKVLNLARTQITDASLEWLTQMPTLTQLVLTGTQISDKGVQHLPQLPNLDYLTLDRTAITNESLTYVHALTKMKYLDLTKTAVSDHGLSSLNSLTGMLSVDLRNAKVTVAGVAALQQALPNCKIEWDGATRPTTTSSDSPLQQWMKTVAALPAEKQVDAVAKKLVELNPLFDAKVTGVNGNGTGGGAPRIENGVVTELGLLTDNVTDISPLRALTGLKVLGCFGNPPSTGQLSDLSPLQGMRLTRLLCYRTQIADLSPLIGMPLTKFDCSFSSVSDLSPLKGMPLTSMLCVGTQVSDLSPLQGMSLTELRCSATKVTDLSPLRGMPLTILVCNGTPIADLSPLKGMALKTLWCYQTRVSDLSPLQGMPLTELACGQLDISDFSPLSDCKSLPRLSLRLTKVTAAGVAALQKALPNCKIEWDGSPKPAP